MQRFVKNVGHFVLAMNQVGSGLRPREFLPVFAFKGDNFATCTSNIRVDVKCIAEMVNRTKTGHSHGTDIKNRMTETAHDLRQQ
jgi:hypothetical protein